MGRPKGAKNKPKQKSDLVAVFYELMATEVTSEDLLKLWALKYIFTRRKTWPMNNNRDIDSTIWSKNMAILATLKCEPW